MSWKTGQQTGEAWWQEQEAERSYIGSTHKKKQEVGPGCETSKACAQDVSPLARYTLELLKVPSTRPPKQFHQLRS